MTSVKFSIRKPKDNGSDPVAGRVSFTPVRRYFDTAKNLILPFAFDAALTADGTATVGLTPTTDAYAWRVDVIPADHEEQTYTRFVEVPDSKDEIAFADLVETDPSTLTPLSMDGSTLMRIMPATGEADAQTLSAKYPEYMVVYPEATSVSAASETLQLMALSLAEAQTGAEQAKAMSAKATADAQDTTLLHETAQAHAEAAQTAASDAQASLQSAQSTASALDEQATVIRSTAADLTARAESVRTAMDDTAKGVESSASDAASRITTAVETVEKLAADATGGEPTTIPETDETDGDASNEAEGKE